MAGATWCRFFFCSINTSEVNMAEVRTPTAQAIPDGSVLLQTGMNYHYDVQMGDNRTLPILRLQTEEKGGKIYPMFRSTDACTVLPVQLDTLRRVRGVWLLEQGGRPEMGQASVLKTVGAFCFQGESRADAAVRTLREKGGIVTDTDALIEVGETPGFGPQFQFPISHYILLNPVIDLTLPLQAGCRLMYYRPRELAELLVKRMFQFDDTIDIVGTFLASINLPHLRKW
jgi:ADP-ribose pyrophosphatase YjhB (NUDIX family)